MTSMRAGVDEVEATFDLGELFFSTTDRKGFILSANSVFTRVSGYSKDEWLGAPHKLVRHPDMPRVVFALLWDRLERGLPVAAYVKNRTKSGGYYWVMALAFPIGDELFSLRLKPSSALLPVVETLYRDLLAEEQAIEMSDRRSSAIDASRASLQRALTGLGFADYEAFMARALPAEVASRFASLGAGAGRLHLRPRDSALCGSHGACQGGLTSLVRMSSGLEGLETLAASYREAAIGLAELADEVSMFAVNAGLTAARTGRRSQVLGEIARLMREAAHDITVEVDRLVGLLDAGTRHIRSLSFDVGRSSLALEVVGQFLTELDDGRLAGELDEAQARHDAVALLGSTVELIESAVARLVALPSTLGALYSSLRRLLRHLRSLRILRIRAEVDSAGDDAAEEFSDIVARVEADLVRGLERLEALVAETVIAQRLDAVAQARELTSHARALGSGRDMLAAGLVAQMSPSATMA
ncbi:MAG: PAS domain-containing protein [Ilumatobacteraceae bacterium]